MMPFKPRQLACFIAVAETLNFRAAAERLFMTQPPLSRQIRQLEQQLGVRLFERDTVRVSLTPEGTAFLQDARRMVAEQQAVLDAYRERATVRTLRLGVTVALDAALFAPALAAVRQADPGMAVQVRSATSLRLIRAVSRGELDAAWIGLPAMTGDLVLERLHADPLLVALPATHPLASAPVLGLADLSGERVFWFERALNPAYFDFSRKVFARSGFAPVWLPEPDAHHVLLAQIAAGLGIGLVAASLAGLQRSGVVYRPLQEGAALAIGVGLVSRAGHPVPDALRVWNGSVEQVGAGEGHALPVLVR